MSKVAQEVALADITRWLDHKKIPHFKRTGNQQSIDTLVEYVMEGTLVVGQDCKIVHVLSTPIEVAGTSIGQLTYKPRLTVAEVKAKAAGVKSSDASGMLLSYVSAMSDQPMQILEKMDTADNSIASTIALFFL